MRQVLPELVLINLNENGLKTWENTTDSDNNSSNNSADYASIKSLLSNSLNCLLQIEDGRLTTTATDIQSKSSKNELLRSFLKDHKKNLNYKESLIGE
jgi:hypothetical protein